MTLQELKVMDIPNNKEYKIKFHTQIVFGMVMFWIWFIHVYQVLANPLIIYTVGRLQIKPQ